MAIRGNNSVIRYGYSSMVALRTGINAVKAPGGGQGVFVYWGIRMSGPKGISYAVDAAVLERLRNREKSFEDLMAAESRLQGLISRCDDLGLPQIVSGSLRTVAEHVGEETPTDVVAARAVSVGKRVQLLSKQLEATLAGQHRQSLSDSLSALAGQLPALADFGTREGAGEKLVEPAPEGVSRADAGADAKRGRVEEILTQLKMPVGELLVLATAAIGARPLRHETLLGQLRRDVRLANDLYDRATAASHNGLGLAGHFDGELPPDVIAAQALVMRIDEEGYSHSLVQRVADAEKIIGDYVKRGDSLRSARDAERARKHVEDAVKESFAALGYAVTDLEPTIVGGAVLSSPSSTHHGVQFAVDKGEIAVRSVRNQIRRRDFAVPDSIVRSKTRGNAQRAFADEVKSNYGYQCAITGIATPTFLVASHIVPWSEDESIRLDPSNGICLSTLVDRAFDTGFLIIAADYTVHIDQTKIRADQVLLTYFSPYEGRRIRLPSENPPRAEYLLRRLGIL